MGQSERFGLTRLTRIGMRPRAPRRPCVSTYYVDLGPKVSNALDTSSRA